jgi:hypothetical protein
MTDRPPARLHVLMASDTREAVILRKGPTNHVATIGWNRHYDTFQLGQWLKGKIYADRCDLSPDGRHFVYFAMNGQWHGEASGAWTAVSRAPYLKALALYPQGSCWGGGGLFGSASTLWIEGEAPGSLVVEHRMRIFIEDSWWPLYREDWSASRRFAHLIRNGWSLSSLNFAGKSVVSSIFEKVVDRNWKLRRAEGLHKPTKKCRLRNRVAYALVHLRKNLEITDDEWEWSDVDHNRLVWTKKGCLYAAEVGTKQLENVVMLKDFNAMRFEPIEAPY